MLFNNGKLFLIDPIPNVFGCTELDAAKFIASLHINKYSKDIINMSKKSMKAFNNINDTTFDILICSEIIRVYRYHPNKQFILECVYNVSK